MAERIYFDNAATSFPKPDCVHKAMDSYARDIGASAGRGAYREAIESGRTIDRARKLIARLIGAKQPNSIIMTFNCTDGLSLAIKGALTVPNSHVIATEMDHNSVLRPLSSLGEQLGIETTYIKADAFGLLDPDDIRRAIRPNTELIAVVHGSNVCGSLQDIAAIGRIARDHNIPYLVDAAQTVGHLAIDVERIGMDFMAFPGHKALLGPLGTGVLYIRPGSEGKLRPLREGGTGSRSELAVQPDFLPDRFESGSHNALGIAGLSAGVEYILERGLDDIRRHEEQLCRIFLDLADANIDGLTVYGPSDIARLVGVFSVNVAGYEPSELSAILEERFGILTRPGLHCAPLAHKAIGSFDLGGTARFSVGPFVTLDQAAFAAESLVRIAKSASVVSKSASS